ncbi:hypothetical protein KIM372_08140 [Bombiscardovia nodaiensis]|uniref:Uncharacterized protein n=1 Tax=Bombiscardovia nodaiensis TaxID=2932181 RepID=A0ABN6SCS2_9BIFI|nr:hypothetical protein KIM372_08140 [Bombiscardovia nodaiensis]
MKASTPMRKYGKKVITLLEPSLEFENRFVERIEMIDQASLNGLRPSVPCSIGYKSPLKEYAEVNWYPQRALRIILTAAQISI